MANNGQHHEFIEFVCKPMEDLYISTNERRTVRIPAGQEYRCSMLREQHFSSLFRHYGKHNGVDKETLVFFFTEELMRELEPNDTPKSVHLKKNDVIVIKHRRQPQPDNLIMRLDLNAEDALELIRAFPKARKLQSSDGRSALHHLAARSGRDGAKEIDLATRLLLAGCDPAVLDNYGRTASDIAKHHRQHELAQLLAPHEFKRQMAVIRAHFLGGSAYARDEQGAVRQHKHDIILKRPCTSSSRELLRDDTHHACVRFLFSNLAHGNQAKNFKRVVTFLYA
eukprot:CAMPEP_0198647074 /NCGR_PEP_ID=MMETSP1467-20131203/2442_1 /TAXON_ID=1462469 /ORGANISM="unid. sp., Strain CCMP2135" /LENGTH=281 /DNA_ID=CAMNT_0044382675 /DNA_START=86 /DNA_END=931 /DNA_ORIENTATION=-